MGLGYSIRSDEIREVIALDALTKLVVAMEYGLDRHVLEDFFASLMFLGPPGVGKSVLQYVGIRDVAGVLSDLRGREVSVVKVSMRVGHEEASRIVEGVVDGRVIPYLHIYLPQTKIWDLEGTPSPNDRFARVGGVEVPFNLWRVDPFILPFLDYTGAAGADRLVTPLIVIDEFNMGRRDVREALFQLARSAEIGRAKLNPLSVVSLVGNTPETNVYVERELPAPLLNRAERFIVEKPTVEGWLAYMREVYGGKWAEEVGAYLTLHPDSLYKEFEEQGSTLVVTPRSWTHLAVRLHVLRVMREKGLVSRGAAERHAKRLVYGLLAGPIASSFEAFVETISRIRLDAVARDPKAIEGLPPEVAAYVLVHVSHMLHEEYRRARPRERDAVVSRILEYARAGRKVLGDEAVSILLSSMPLPVKVRIASRLPEEERRRIGEIQRRLRELEEE